IQTAGEARADAARQALTMTTAAFQREQIVPGRGRGYQPRPIAGTLQMGGQRVQVLTIERPAGAADIADPDRIVFVERRIGLGDARGAANVASGQTEALRDGA